MSKTVSPPRSQEIGRKPPIPEENKMLKQSEGKVNMTMKFSCYGLRLTTDRRTSDCHAGGRGLTLTKKGKLLVL